mmetsp:Transcript_28008/g.82357  ORF Transcript_28008/g.82357 Transcript_28008/m.82357 type:complete len:296 (-) Transcript_28008:464-1351(-)
MLQLLKDYLLLQNSLRISHHNCVLPPLVYHPHSFVAIQQILYPCGLEPRPVPQVVVAPKLHLQYLRPVPPHNGGPVKVRPKLPRGHIHHPGRYYLDGLIHDGLHRVGRHANAIHRSVLHEHRRVVRPAGNVLNLEVRRQTPNGNRDGRVPRGLAPLLPDCGIGGPDVPAPHPRVVRRRHGRRAVHPRAHAEDARIGGGEAMAPSPSRRSAFVVVVVVVDDTRRPLVRRKEKVGHSERRALRVGKDVLVPVVALDERAQLSAVALAPAVQPSLIVERQSVLQSQRHRDDGPILPPP